MAKKLTAEILQGARETKDIEIEVGGETYEITIRPLTVGERSKVNATGQKGMALRGGADGPVGQLSEVMKADAESDTLAVSIGMVDPDMTIKQITESILPVKEIANKIKELSGMAVDKGDQPAKEHVDGAEFRENEA